MPNIRSSKKRMRQSARRRETNKDQRSTLRSAIKRVRAAGNRDEAEVAYRRAESLLDRAARRGLIGRNAAARNKSRLKKIVVSKTG